MLEAFERNLRTVWRRCSINLLLKHAAKVLTVAGIIAVLAVLIERLLAVSVMNLVTVSSFWAAAILLILVLWLLRQPRRLQVSLLLDERLKLHERFSTTLALADSADPFADAARREAREAARGVNVQGYFPILPPKCWIYAVSTWLIAGALVLYMPQKDLLGFLRRDRQQQKTAEQLQKAKADVRQAADSVKLAVKELDEPELDDALSKLEQTAGDANPQDVKRQAIRKLGDLSDRVKQMQSSTELASLNMMQRMFKQLRGSPGVFSQEMRLALARGDFAQASALINQIQKRLESGSLSPEQQKALAEQLKQLAKRLQELARSNEELKNELEKLGLDKDLAKLSQEQLRLSLQKQGLDAEKIEELLRKAAASRAASSRCAGLGSAMGACGLGAGGLSADELANVMEQLDELEALQQDFMLTQATLDEIGRAIGLLGEGMYMLGAQGPFREGLSDKFSPGTGGPGMGYGPLATDENGDASTKRTRVRTEPGQGPVIASWYFQETQIKGEAKRDFSEVVQTARDGAAEAISENQIPRKYEEAIKKYFGRLEESGGQ